MTSEVFNIDCMEGMKQYPDKYFDLAVVDPPYDIERFKNPNGRLQRFGDTRKGNNNPPDKKYFNELIRISKNQIIWGANHFWENNLGNCTHFIFWDKVMTVDNYASGELAWTSFDGTAKKFEFAWNGMLQGDMKNKEIRVHPFQKPVALYSWIYKNYLPNGGKVIDTHLGSGSNRIAADKAGNIDFVGYELDKDYYEAQEKRWKNYKAQLKLFS